MFALPSSGYGARASLGARPGPSLFHRDAFDRVAGPPVPLKSRLDQLPGRLIFGIRELLPIVSAAQRQLAIRLIKVIGERQQLGDAIEELFDGLRPVVLLLRPIIGRSANKITAAEKTRF